MYCINSMGNKMKEKKYNKTCFDSPLQVLVHFLNQSSDLDFYKNSVYEFRIGTYMVLTLKSH